MVSPEGEPIPYRDLRLWFWFFWATWLIGPASFGIAFALCRIWPSRCTDPPNLALACVLVLTHLLAGAMTLGQALAPGPNRRRAEFWLLLLYWAAIAGYVAPSPLDATVRWSCARLAGALVLLMPSLAITRFAMRSRGDEHEPSRRA